MALLRFASVPCRVTFSFAVSSLPQRTFACVPSRENSAFFFFWQRANKFRLTPSWRRKIAQVVRRPLCDTNLTFAFLVRISRHRKRGWQKGQRVLSFFSPARLRERAKQQGLMLRFTLGNLERRNFFFFFRSEALALLAHSPSHITNRISWLSVIFRGGLRIWLRGVGGDAFRDKWHYTRKYASQITRYWIDWETATEELLRKTVLSSYI